MEQLHPKEEWGRLTQTLQPLSSLREVCPMLAEWSVLYLSIYIWLEGACIYVCMYGNLSVCIGTTNSNSSTPVQPERGVSHAGRMVSIIF